MRPEPEVNYAVDPYGYRPPERKRGLLRVLVPVVLALGLGAGAAYYYYGGSLPRLASNGSGPPVLEPDPTPTKLRPDQPGGIIIPHQDKIVYERLHNAKLSPSVERLLPPPEEPLPRPVVTQPVPPPPATVAVLPSAAAPEPTTQPPASSPPATEPPPPLAQAKPALPAGPSQPAVTAAVSVKAATPPPGKEPPKELVKEPATSGSKELPQPVVAAPAPIKAATLPSSPPAKDASKEPAAGVAKEQQLKEPPPKEAAKQTGGSGNWRVQLASVRTEEEAKAEWQRLSSRYPEAIAGLSLQILRADLGEKGIYFRVHGVGGDEEHARSVCDRLRAQNVGCVLVKP